MADLLVTGPFPDALRAAIEAKGLSLQRIQQRLSAKGAPISIAALSYWQSGRRRPERQESLAALRHLEDVLDVPAGALGALLGPPRPRGRGYGPSAVLPIEALWHSNERLAELLAKVDTSSDALLSRISQHDRVEIAENGGHRSLRVRQVLRAERDGADRWVLVYDGAPRGGPLPQVRALRSARLGQVLADESSGVLVAELMFAVPLARGETVVMEYELAYPGPHYPTGDDSYCRRFRLPVREYVLEVRFDPAARPVRCQQFTSAPGERSPEFYRNLTVDAWGYAHAVALGFGPGVFGMRWQH
ncbi:helix-turn-helix transcriptional regulator [Solihabitans fulvus]|uniref:Helix-turn-helix transcriptional regulator n=1 Tax=Solihabitans fulvus TaxID=1892852 RepID=A0A5B2XFS9_9PSEU|nr:helix-turn-helix transcriptional regulator [Solihabitans fulvus]KAA2261974.1 helix-turn-helix transcriptional regulator [Solihabitans fulvus]